MRTINVESITKKIKEAVIQINYKLPKDVEKEINNFFMKEESQIGKGILKNIIDNNDISKTEGVPLCQDTGMIVAFVEIGQDVQLEGGSITEAINEGVKQGYKDGYLRKSVVNNPLDRENTKDNTPAIIYYDIVEGNNIIIDITAKGFGSENMSRLKMLKPSEGIKGVEDFVLETVELAGPNPCPPLVVGVGIGGTMDKACQLAKKSLIRPIDKDNDNARLDKIEKDLLNKINNLGIGPQGMGGRTTALKVNIEMFPTHIAGLPVAVNLNCHSSRHITLEF